MITRFTQIPQASQNPSNPYHKPLKKPSLNPKNGICTPTTTDSGILFREKILYLKSLKVNPTKALNKNPNFRSTSLQTLKSVENCLSSMGILRSEFGRIFDIRLLGVLVDVLLVSSVEGTLMPKLEYLMGLGFEYDDVVNMVLRSPGLLTFSIENNFKPKFEYFLNEMKGDLGDLKRFPQYFSYSLEGKIMRRHRLLVDHGVSVPLWEMLKVSDGEFTARLIDARLRLGDKSPWVSEIV
ncbi:transcription termination factor MTEF1, chloroplastic [Tanacetum coccineum]